MITKVLEYVTCFCGEKLEKKQDNSRQYKGIEDSKSDDLNEEKEKITFLIDFMSDKCFPRKKTFSSYSVCERLTLKIPKLEIDHVTSKIVYDSDTEIFKTSEGI
jgi:hypothetical protein